MSYIDEQLEFGERIVYRARVRAAAYLYALAALVLVMSPGAISALSSTELALTDKRVIGKVGRVLSKEIDLPFARVETVKARRSLLGTICDYGTLTITGSGGVKVTFKGIAAPLEVKTRIDEAVEMAVLGRKLSQAAADS